MKTIVITGGSEGLGKAIASALVKDHTVYILARTESVLAATASEIACQYKVCDVTKYTEVAKVIAEIESETNIDVLVNNAGAWIEGSLEENEFDQIKKVIDINLTGVINVSKAVLPGMKVQKKGLIVNINSQSGLYGKAERSVYHASKWGVTGFTKSLQDELLPHGIRVTGVYPAKIETELFSKNGINKSMTDALDPRAVADMVRYIIEADDSIFFPEIGIKRVM